MGTPCSRRSLPRKEAPPQTASVIWELDHAWGDQAWVAGRAGRQGPGAPLSIYEVHLGSWLRGPGGAHLSYTEIAPRLVGPGGLLVDVGGVEQPLPTQERADVAEHGLLKRLRQL